jgi:hypothetical protein
MTPNDANRPLSTAEYDLARWMLENGNSEARNFLSQLDDATVMPWRCPCGCASINFQIGKHPPAPPEVHILGDYMCGPLEDPAGAFIYSSGELLAGIEVYALAGEAPNALPTAPLRQFGD